MQKLVIIFLLSVITSYLVATFLFEDQYKESISYESECKKEQGLISGKIATAIEQIEKMKKAIALSAPKEEKLFSYCVYDATQKLEDFFKNKFSQTSVIVNYSRSETIYEKRLGEKFIINESAEFIKSLKTFPRIETIAGIPYDGQFYGITNKEHRLNEKECSSPRLAYLHTKLRPHELFFALNLDKQFKGKLAIHTKTESKNIEHTINFGGLTRNDEFEDITSIERFDTNSYGKYIENIHLTSEMANPYRFNTCNKAISIVGNICTFDKSFDMELRNLHYSLDSDSIDISIYCKKSSENYWTKISEGLLLRTK